MGKTNKLKSVNSEFGIFSFGRSYEPKQFKARELGTDKPVDDDKRPKLVSQANRHKISTAANEDQKSSSRPVKSAGSKEVQVLSKIKLINAPVDPLYPDIKIRIEEAMRSCFCLRIGMHLREYAAYRIQKLVIELTDSDKLTLTEEEQTAKIEQLTKKHLKFLQEQATLDANCGLPDKLKTLAWQGLQFGRNLIIITYQDDNETIKGLKTINTRRLQEPILDDENDLEFEGCFVDNQPLDKNSMIYYTYEERDISPNSEGYGYTPLETVLTQAEIHTLIVQDGKEIALSAFLPSILLKILTENLTSAQKRVRITNILNEIQASKIIGVPDDQVSDAVMLDMKPDYNGITIFTQGYEKQMYNALHIPLFMAHSDEIANRATANKSVKLFYEGPVADDQARMSNCLGKHWYDPLLREYLKKNNELETDTTDSSVTQNTDTTTPEGDEMPLPFLVRRKFECPPIEDFIDLADSLATLKRENIWDVEQANKILGTEEIVTRIKAAEEERKKEFQQNLDQQKDNKNFGKSPVPSQNKD